MSLRRLSLSAKELVHWLHQARLSRQVQLAAHAARIDQGDRSIELAPETYFRGTNALRTPFLKEMSTWLVGRTDTGRDGKIL